MNIKSGISLLVYSERDYIQETYFMKYAYIPVWDSRSGRINDQSKLWGPISASMGDDVYFKKHNV